MIFGNYHIEGHTIIYINHYNFNISGDIRWKRRLQLQHVKLISSILRNENKTHLCRRTLRNNSDQSIFKRLVTNCLQFERQ